MARPPLALGHHESVKTAREDGRRVTCRRVRDLDGYTRARRASVVVGIAFDQPDLVDVWDRQVSGRWQNLDGGEVGEGTTRPTGASFAYRPDTPKITISSTASRHTGSHDLKMPSLDGAPRPREPLTRGCAPRAPNSERAAVLWTQDGRDGATATSHSPDQRYRHRSRSGWA